MDLNSNSGITDICKVNEEYQGSCSPCVVRSIILDYSKEGDTVLDQFVGGGTTAVEAILTHRNFIGIDINFEAVEITSKKLEFEYNTKAGATIMFGDARGLYLADESIDLICAQPPYADIIHYSEDNELDLSLLTPEEFLNEMDGVASESYRVLKKGKYCAILMGDICKKGMVQSLAFETMKIFEKVGFNLKETIIKEENNCMTTAYRQTKNEYLFIFKK